MTLVSTYQEGWRLLPARYPRKCLSVALFVRLGIADERSPKKSDCPHMTCGAGMGLHGVNAAGWLYVEQLLSGIKVFTWFLADQSRISTCEKDLERAV